MRRPKRRSDIRQPTRASQVAVRSAVGELISFQLLPAGAVNLLNSATIASLSGVIQRVQKHSFPAPRDEPIFFAQSWSPSLVVLNIDPVFVSWRGDSIVRQSADTAAWPNSCEVFVAPLPHAGRVEAHQLEKNPQIFGPAVWIVGRFKQRSNDYGTGQDNWFGAPPFAERAENFSRARFAFQEALQRKLSDRELDFEQGFRAVDMCQKSSS